MLKRIIERKMAGFESEWGYSMDYMREVLGLGLKPIKRFMDAQAIGTYRVGISEPAAYAAKILGVMAGDCGPCVQLVVDMALRAGVSPAALADLVAGELDRLPDDMRLPAKFTRALLARTDDLPGLRERVRETYGTAGLVSVAYAVINAGMYPTLKYALGHGHACAKIEIGELRIVPVSPVAPAPLTEVA